MSNNTANAKKEKRKVPSINGIPGGTGAGEVALKSPMPSTRRKSSARQKPRVEQPSAKQHRFQKKTFPSPTWCQYANKFIWGLNKSGYECRVCNLAVSRRFIGDAKKSVCGQPIDRMDNAQTASLTQQKVFTIYLPHGAKKSIIMNPDTILGTVLEKICRERGIDIDAYVPEDTNGKVLKLTTQLGKIEGNEITFTAKEDHKQVEEATALNTNRSKISQEPSVSSAGNGKKKSANQLKSSVSATHTHTSSSTSSLMLEPSSAPKKSVVEAYEFGTELGSGAFSIVRSATHKETGLVVAIKILDKYEEDDEQTAKFKQEIAIISSLHHENIVQFHELDEDEENFYVVMELVGGGELFDFIINNGALPEADAAKVAAQVLKAVEYMHSVGTAHRDLKPENLLFSSVEDKVVKIADFGESKSFKEGTLSTYCGTPDYMAPEIIRGDNYGPEVDVWAVGVITYVMLAGFPPFDGENDVEVFASILSIKYDFPLPEWEKISSSAKEFIQAILVDRPEKRLTASQALSHKWIVESVEPEFRVNSKPTMTMTSTSTTTTTTTTTTSMNALLTLTSSIATTPPKYDHVKSPPTAPGTTPLDNRRTSKRENRMEDSLTTISSSSNPSVGSISVNQLASIPSVPSPSSNPDELDLSRKPKKAIIEVIDELLGLCSDGNDLVIGELKTMKVVMEGTTGKPKTVDLERVIYTTYWKRLKEIHTFIKKNNNQNKKKKQ